APRRAALLPYPALFRSPPGGGGRAELAGGDRGRAVVETGDDVAGGITGQAGGGEGHEPLGAVGGRDRGGRGDVGKRGRGRAGRLVVGLDGGRAVHGLAV